MTPTAGLTMAKVTDVQLALHQICADETNPSTMTARIMSEHDVTTDDVMLVCDVAYLAIEDARIRNIKAMKPTYDLAEQEAYEPPQSEFVAMQEIPPEVFEEPVQEPQTPDVSQYASIINENLAMSGRSPADLAKAESARLKAITAENKAKLGFADG